MKNYRVLIVEDDDVFITTLTTYLTRLPFFCTPEICKTAGEALDRLNHQKFDIIFLDMHLPDLPGTELLRALPHHYPVVATTAHPNYAVDCYDLNVIDFLLKPFTFQRFSRAVSRTLDVQFTTNGMVKQESIFVKVSRSMQRFTYSEISYVNAFGIYSKIYQNQHATVVNETISTLENRLPSQKFMRVHKSYIVHLDSVTAYTQASLTVDGARIPLGAIYRHKFEGFLQLLEQS